MRRIEQEVTNQDRHIKKQAQKVKKALRETVELEGLHQKIMGKYLRFLQQKVAGKIDEENAQPQNAAPYQNTRTDTLGDRLESFQVPANGGQGGMNDQAADWQFDSLNMSVIPLE